MTSLPAAPDHGLPDSSTIVVPVPADGLTLHRLLEHVTPSQRDFEASLSRNQAKLRGVPELFRTSISHWLEHDQAMRASDRSTSFAARLELLPRTLVRLALTEHLGHGHVDVWAHPHDLLAAVVRVVRTRGQS